MHIPAIQHYCDFVRWNLRFNLQYGVKDLGLYLIRLGLGLGFHKHKHTHTHTHNPFYNSLDFVRDNPGELVPEETFTHSHLSWSSIIPYLLLPSIMIHGILSVQFTCLTVSSTISLQVFFGLPLGLAASTSYSILHTILHTIIVFFLQHMPIPMQPVLL